MNSVGIVRHMDATGRIVIPIEMRRQLGITIQDRLAISVEGERILIQKHSAGCIFCQNQKGELTEFEGRLVCENCLQKLRSL